MSLDVPRVAAGHATPYLGITERITMAAWLIWMAILSAQLLRQQRAHQVRTGFSNNCDQRCAVSARDAVERN
jgi:hypothetical protein